MPNPSPLQPGVYYHIYNRGNNGEDIFREERNYAYFLKLYAQHILPVADTLTYCLMRNHFHLLIYVRVDVMNQKTAAKGMSPISQGFADLFKAYTQAINKAHARTGSLFEHPFHRRPVTENAYFNNLVVYIHQNPQKHGFVKDFRDWRYSSYHTLMSDGASRLKRAKLMEQFAGREQFDEAHKIVRNDAWLNEQDFD